MQKDKLIDTADRELCNNFLMTLSKADLVDIIMSIHNDGELPYWQGGCSEVDYFGADYREDVIAYKQNYFYEQAKKYGDKYSFHWQDAGGNDHDTEGTLMELAEYFGISWIFRDIDLEKLDGLEKEEIFMENIQGCKFFEHPKIYDKYYYWPDVSDLQPI